MELVQVNKSQLPNKLHIYSPLIESTTLSQHLNHRVLLKMVNENKISRLILTFLKRMYFNPVVLSKFVE